MKRYLDAGKLIAEIERRRLSNRYIDTEGYENELLEIIASLQQEQPESGCSEKPNNHKERSEDDEGMLNCIIATLCEESHGGRETNDKMVTWLDNRLRLLRPQPHWKPSEEQMEALECAERWYTYNMGHNPALYQLLCDLKKL